MEEDRLEARRDRIVAENEAAFRRHVEAVGPLIDTVAPPAPLDLQCECGGERCDALLRVDLDTWRLVRLAPVLAVAPDHAPGEGPRENVEGADLVSRHGRWGETVADLAGALRRLVEDGDEVNTFVLVEADRERNLYAQFALQDGRLWCEVVHNRYLAPGDTLGEVAIARLLRRGFRSPASAAGNWFRVIEPGEGFRYVAIARLALGALTEVYGLRAGLPLNIEASFNEWPKDPRAPHPALIVMPFLHGRRKQRNRERGRRGGGPY